MAKRTARSLVYLRPSMAGLAPPTFTDQILALNPLAFWYAGDGASIPAQMNGATDGGAVTTWDDLSANGYHVTQAGAASLKPTYDQSNAAFNDRGCLTFDGGDYLSRNVAAVPTGGLTTFNIIAVVSTVTAATQACFYSEGNSAETGLYEFAITGPTVATAVGFRHQSSGPTLEGGANFNNGAVKIVTIRKITTSSYSLRLNGVEVDTKSTNGSITGDRIAIGCLLRAAASNNWVGNSAAYLLFNSDIYATVEPLLAEHYGITLP